MERGEKTCTNTEKIPIKIPIVDQSIYTGSSRSTSPRSTPPHEFGFPSRKNSIFDSNSADTRHQRSDKVSFDENFVPVYGDFYDTEMVELTPIPEEEENLIPASSSTVINSTEADIFETENTTKIQTDSSNDENKCPQTSASYMETDAERDSLPGDIKTLTAETKIFPTVTISRVTLSQRTPKLDFTAPPEPAPCERKITSKNSSKKHFCTICPKSFVRPAELSRHIRTHTNERPFSCHICKEKFKRNDHLKSHLTKHTQKKEHKCELCEYETNRRDTLKRHVKNKHKKEFLQIAKSENM